MSYKGNRGLCMARTRVADCMVDADDAEYHNVSSECHVLQMIYFTLICFAPVHRIATGFATMSEAIIMATPTLYEDHDL